MGHSYLFTKGDAFGLMEYQNKKLKNTIEQLSVDDLREGDDAVVAALAAKFRLSAPALREEDIHVAEHGETRVDVSRDPMRLILDRSRPFYVQGTRTVIAVPFTGEPILFNVRPSTFSTVFPRGEVVDSEIHLVYVRTDANAEAVKQEYTREVASIRQHLQWLESSFQPFNNSLEATIRSQIAARRQKLSTNSDMLSGLGLPLRQRPVAHSADPMPKSSRRTRPEDTWDIFISHASEDKKAFVRDLAEALRKLGLRVWYDEFALTLGDSLRQKIDQGLARSRYGVVVLSTNFFAKNWPKMELDGLVTREVEGRKVILPVWHGVTFEQVRAFSPLLAGKVAADSSRGMSVVVEAITRVVRNS